MNLSYVHGGPLGRARIRQQPGDFQVFEELGFEPSGEGPHWFLEIEKTSTTTPWLVRSVASWAKLSQRDIGYSGLKDRHAVTTQWLSVPAELAQNLDPHSFAVDKCRLLQVTRNLRKLRRGAHASNRFRMLLREFDGDAALLAERVKTIAKAGVPNYFGPQRFGRNAGNLRLAERLFAGARMKRHERDFALSASRSAIFNALVSARIDKGVWDCLLEGDRLNLDGRGSVFTPDAEDAELVERLKNGAVHPSASLWGRQGSLLDSSAKELEEAVAGDLYPGFCAGLVASSVDSHFRPVRLLPQNLVHAELEAGHVLEFSLPSGAFATALLRELVIFDET